MTYRFEHDPYSGALYIHVRDGEYQETIPLVEEGFGASVDVDAEGNVLGFEFLSFDEYAEAVARHGGALEVPGRMRGQDESGLSVTASYDELSAEEVSRKLDSLSTEELRRIRVYERHNKNRAALVEQIDRKLRRSPAG